MPVTPLFAAVFAIIYVYLSFRVIAHRFTKQISLGTGGDKNLEKAIRIQANFGEYIPISLLLFWFLEVITYASGLVLILGTVLLLARFSHIIGLNDTKNKLIFRQVGMVATFTVILIASVKLIWHYLPY